MNLLDKSKIKNLLSLHYMHNFMQRFGIKLKAILA